MARTLRNPADFVLRTRVCERVQFPHLTERLCLRLSAVGHYTARSHFEAWHRRVGAPDFERFTGIFAPLYFVDFETYDVPLAPHAVLRVRGETHLAKNLDARGGTERLVREGRHTLFDKYGQTVARAFLVNAFTRYDPDPARRRVRTLPPELGLGPGPSRVTELPQFEDLLGPERPPDFADPEPSVWHYEQTDPNRHVNGFEYLRVMESYVADTLYRCGHDWRRLYFCRARILYRKPCFRGEGYLRAVWVRGEAPLVLSGAFFKAAETGASRKPAAVVELTLSQHSDAS